MNARFILGGTFDPLHNGHMFIANFVHTFYRAEKITLLPSSSIITHKPPPVATDAQRLEMLHLVLKTYPFLELDPRELLEQAYCPSIKTLRALKEESDSQIFFLMSTESFAGIGLWESWVELFDLVNFIILPRLGYELPKLDFLPPQVAIYSDAIELDQTRAAGQVYLISKNLCRAQKAELHLSSASSTQIRLHLSSGLPIDSLLPQIVSRYLKQNQIY